MLHFAFIVKAVQNIETRYKREVESRKNIGGILFDSFVTKFERSLNSLNDFYEAMVDLQLNFEKMGELSGYIQEYSLLATAQKEDDKSKWRKELKYRLGGVGEKIEEKLICIMLIYLVPIYPKLILQRGSLQKKK